MLRFLGSLFGGNSNTAMERAQGEPTPPEQNRDDSSLPAVGGDLPDDKNPLKYFYDYLDAKQGQFKTLVTKWDDHSKSILQHTDTRPCSKEHESCVLDSEQQAKSTFQLIKEKFKQAFESEAAFFKEKLEATETDVATMKAHIDELIRKYNDSTDEQERREAAVHMARAQMFLLQEILDYMQAITESFKSAVDAEKKAEIVIGFLIKMFSALILKAAPAAEALLALPVGNLMPDFGVIYQDFLESRSEYEQLGTRLMVDDVLAEDAKADAIALAAEKDDKPASPVVPKLRRSTDLFKPVPASVGAQAIAAVLSEANSNNGSGLRTSPRN